MSFLPSPGCCVADARAVDHVRVLPRQRVEPVTQVRVAHTGEGGLLGEQLRGPGRVAERGLRRRVEGVVGDRRRYRASRCSPRRTPSRRRGRRAAGGDDARSTVAIRSTGRGCRYAIAAGRREQRPLVGVRTVGQRASRCARARTNGRRGDAGRERVVAHEPEHERDRREHEEVDEAEEHDADRVADPVAEPAEPVLHPRRHVGARNVSASRTHAAATSTSTPAMVRPRSTRPAPIANGTTARAARGRDAPGRGRVRCRHLRPGRVVHRPPGRRALAGSARVRRACRACTERRPVPPRSPGRSRPGAPPSGSPTRRDWSRCRTRTIPPAGRRDAASS